MPNDLSPIQRTHIISCIGIDKEYELLAHFLDHYIHLGVPTANFHLILHTWHEESKNESEAKALFRKRGLREPDVWSGQWSAAAHWARRRELQIRNIPPQHWVLHADADELHEYPTDLNTFLSYCERRGVNCVQGPLIDRIASNGMLVPISENRPLHETFPLLADVRYAVGWTGQHYGMGGTVKIMAATSEVFARKGGHGPTRDDGARPAFLFGQSLDQLPQLRYPAFRFSMPLKVHHYKWNADLKALLDERRNNTRESKASQEFTGKLSEYLATHERIDLDQVPLDSGRRSALPWQFQIRYIAIRGRVEKPLLQLAGRLNKVGDALTR